MSRLPFAVLSAGLFISAFAGAHGRELPGCEVDGYSQECRRSTSTATEIRYLPGCAVSCPANGSPICKPGYLSGDCDVPPTMPVCRCD